MKVDVINNSILDMIGFSHIKENFLNSTCYSDMSKYKDAYLLIFIKTDERERFKYTIESSTFASIMNGGYIDFTRDNMDILIGIKKSVFLNCDISKYKLKKIVFKNSIPILNVTGKKEG